MPMIGGHRSSRARTRNVDDILTTEPMSSITVLHKIRTNDQLPVEFSLRNQAAAADEQVSAGRCVLDREVLKSLNTTKPQKI